MTKAAQLIVEVKYVPLPANEMEERRYRLRLLLFRGSSRWLKDHGEQSREGEPLMVAVTKSK